VRIVGDVGGTHVRLARLDEGGRPRETRRYGSAGFAGPAEAVEQFLEDLGQPEGAARRAASPFELALAIAGPAQGENLALTNLHWSFSRTEVRQRLGLERFEVLNDFEALALSVPSLEGDDKLLVKEGRPASVAPIVVVGPGTGLGAASLLPAGSRYAVVAGEGGHRDLAAANEEEWQVVRKLAIRFGHVSAERALSGPGIENLYGALGAIHGVAVEEVGAAAIARLSRSGDALARRATELFSGWLGAVAGDLALTLGARGGVYLAGGVLEGLGEAFDRTRFGERFLAKGRLRAFLEPIPVWRIVRPDAALLGCAARLLENSTA
jgi:glucokinase